MAEAWLRAATGMMRQATPATAQVAMKVLKTGKKAAILLGGEATEEQYKAVKKLGVKVLATGPAAKAFGLEVQDPILAAKKDYDALGFIGFDYWYLNQLLSHLRSFTKVKTVSLGRFYQPNAQFSLNNLSLKDWLKEYNDLGS